MKKIETQNQIICQNPTSLFNYFGWPSVAKLPDGVVIKAGKLRGVESNGMLCSMGELKLTVHECPAQKRLVELGEHPDPVMCRATEVFDKALADGSPFDVALTRTGDCSCTQRFRRGDIP